MSNLSPVTLEKEIPSEVLSEIKLLRNRPSPGLGPALHQLALMDHEKRVSRIHKALDSDDVELLRLLLSESNEISLNNAFALHYAAAYSDAKTFKKVLDLRLADLNLKNSRGLTVLHVAARRKVPSILVALLDSGASIVEPTSDGQTALDICRRMTRPKDYNENVRRGQETNKDKLCIDLLERQMKNVPLSGKRLVHPEVSDDDLHMLEYLESRGKN